MRSSSGSRHALSSTPATPEAPPPPKPKGIVGKVVFKTLKQVRPNDWNPNRMEDFVFQSLKQGLRDDGWLSSDSLLVWGKDEKGVVQNVIINGEHRWRGAQEIGMLHGPMVFLDGLTRDEAAKLTIKLDNKRGGFDQELLSGLVRSFSTPPEMLGLELGFSQEALQRLLAPGLPVHPPADFAEVSVDVKTDYCCPKCGYEWSGSPSKKKA